MAAKIFLVLGLVITLLGVVMTSLGGNSLAELEDYEMDVEGMSVWSNSDGSTDYTYSGEEMYVMVRDDVRCDTFTLTMKNETDVNHYQNDECTEDGEKPYSFEDDPKGWYHMGTISWWDYNYGEYTINSSADVELVPMWAVIGDVATEVAGGVAGLFGGFVFACCGISFMILGGIFALTLKPTNKPQVNMAQGSSGFTTSTSTVSNFTSTTPSKEDELASWDESES
jgi:glucose uptake protein GlcU|tara:strand:+ start:392 stop:1069 length:678 start_codon:yes stop_codon:yes gene_type:complete